MIFSAIWMENAQGGTMYTMLKIFGVEFEVALDLQLEVYYMDSTTVQGMDSRTTLLKFVCPRISYYASHYHYASQSIAFSVQ